MNHSYIWSGNGRLTGNRDAWLKFLAVIFIGVMAGPEIGLAVEMTTLLEILGAAIFFFSFSVGAKMLMLDIGVAIRNFVSPLFVSTLWRPAAIVCVVARAAWLVAWVLASGLIARQWAAAVGLT